MTALHGSRDTPKRSLRLRPRDRIALLALALVLPILHQTAPSAAQGQVFKAPQGVVENVRFEQVAGGVMNIRYDLKSDDPNAVFSILLEVSEDGGASFTVKPVTVSGDIGSGVRAGAGKSIVWQASRDIENLQVDQFKFNIRASAGLARPVPTGRLVVSSTPPGATVFVDGVNRGATPLTITELLAGTHEVRVARDGFLENRRSIEVSADAAETLSVALTAMDPGAAPGGQSRPGPPAAPAPRSGVKKFVWIGVAAGGAAAAGLALGGGGDGGGGSGGGGGGGGGGGAGATLEICGNGIDDNGNGQIDESPCPPPPQEICGNGIDDDLDGQIDEGCTPPTCEFTINPTTVPEFPSGGGQQPVNLTVAPPNCSPSTWTTSNANASWISLSTGSGSGSATVTLTAPANQDTSTRRGSVTIASQTANVSQAGRIIPPCSFRAAFDGGGSTTQVSGHVVGERRRISVEANDSSCEWSVSGTPSWFPVAQGASTQRGNGSVVMETSAVNPTGRDRRESFRVANIEFAVTQCAARC